MMIEQPILSGEAKPTGSMQVILPPELELIVSRQLISGKYLDEIAVIRAAIELLEQQEDIY